MGSDPSIGPVRQYGAREITAFDERKTVQRTPIIQQNSINGFTSLRDLDASSGGGTVTNNVGDGSYELAVSGSGQEAILRTTRGRYGPGFGGEAGRGVALSGLPQGDQFAEIGLSDGTNGFYWGWDSNGPYVALLRDGDETKIRESQFNVIKNPGIRPTQGYLYQVQFTHYGAGPIEFQVLRMTPGRVNLQETVVVHRVSPTNFPSVLNPNLPIHTRVSAGTSSNPLSAYVTGSQYSIVGKYAPNYRFTGDRRLSLSVGTTFLPLVTLRRKADYVQVEGQTEGWSIISAGDLILQLRLNADLTGASYVTPSEHTANETAFEADISATGISGGEVLYPDLHRGGQGNQAAFSGTNALLEIPERQPVTLCARTLSGTSDVSAYLRVQEGW